MSAPVLSRPIPGLGRVLRVPGGFAVRVHPRSVAVAGVLTLIVLVLLVVSVGTGDFAIGPGEVIASIFGGGDQATRFIVNTLRLPRALCALLVGGALGASGAIFQSVTRNPLGSPDIVGFVQGASAGAVAEIVFFGGGTAATAGGAVAGGLLAAVAAYLLALRGTAVQYRLVLVGIGLAAMLTAITNYLISRTTLDQAQAAELWLVGSLNGRSWGEVEPLLAAVVVLAPIVALLSGPLRTLELGDDAAGALGVGLGRARLALVFTAVGLCAVAVAASGPIVFIALAGPQISRRLTRATGPGVACAALTGSALLLGSDVFAQRALGSTDLPVGVVTGVLGGIYLMWLLTREWRQ